MKNFLRAVRLVLGYRATVAATIACSLLIAVLWGGNIGVLYPILEVAQSGKSAPEWAADKLAKARRHAAEQRVVIAEIDAKIAGAAGEVKNQLAIERRLLQSRLDAEERVVERLSGLQPYLNHLPGDPFRLILLLLGVVMVGTIIKDFLIVAHTYLLARLTGLSSMDLQRQFFRHTMRMDPATYDERGTAALMSHMGLDIGNLSTGVSSLFGSSLREPMKMTVCLIGAALISWRLLVLSLVLTPLAVFLIHRLAKSLRRAVQRSLDTGVEMNRIVFEAFHCLPMVQSYTMEREENRRFDDISLQAYGKSMRIAFYNSLSKPLTEILGIGIVCVALASGAYLVLNQETHLFGVRMSDRPLGWPALIVFYGFLVGLSDPARRLSDIYGALQRGIAGADRLYPILDQQPHILSPAKPTPLPAVISRVDYERVNFRYSSSDLVLQDINLSLHHGEAVAIVGANGCGKSTLANLLPRFYDPVEGSVKIDGVDLRAVSLEDLRSRIAIVSQQTTLFNSTVIDNIRYGSTGATDEEVHEAARRAHAHSFITQLADGYNSSVGQAGQRLSGGQRQRIILARAILRDPQMLILDEATNQIDPESEFLIHESIKQFIKGRLTLMITHRLSTLELADRIIVMADGRVVDFGGYSELKERCELFRRLCTSAFRESA